MQFGNVPLLEGLDQIRNFLGATWAGLEMMRHETESFGKEYRTSTLVLGNELIADNYYWQTW